MHDQVDYTYDFAGNRLTRDIPSSLYATNDRDQKYTYDGLHRLKTYEQDYDNPHPNFEQEWTLDQLGNWTTFKQNDDGLGAWELDQDRAHNDVNEIDTNNDHADGPGASITATTGTNWIDPKYDAAGNMTKGPIPANPAAAQLYVYDAWNRLVEVTDVMFVSIQENEYDGLNRRIIRDETGGSGDKRHFYYNRQWQVLVESVEDTSSEVADAMYSYHPQYVDAVAVRIRDADAHFYLHDANYNVTAMTDDAGTVKERYSYTPYGKVKFLAADFSSRGSSAISNEYLYTGRRLDPETHLQINRNRFYHQQLGRWVNRDPIGYDGSQWNLYEYVNGMPIRYVDPEGKKKWWWIFFPWMWGCGGPPPYTVGPPTPPGTPPLGCGTNPNGGNFPTPPAGATAKQHYDACDDCNTHTDKSGTKINSNS